MSQAQESPHDQPAYQTLHVTVSDTIQTITLNRPERRNALTAEMVRELTQAFARASDSDLRVIILTGAGQSFCAGLDLEELRKMADRSPDDHLQDSENIATMLRTLYDLPIPTIAAVNGAAVAGGMGLATICDFTYAVPEARFGYTEVRIGFIPAIVSAFLIAQTGEKRARDLLLSGRLITAEEAHAIGLVTQIVEAAELQATVAVLAHTLVANSPTSLRATKHLLSSQQHTRLDMALYEAVQANAELRGTADFHEGLAAFLEKRKPMWR